MSIVFCAECEELCNERDWPEGWDYKTDKYYCKRCERPEESDRIYAT